MPHKNLQYLT